MEEHSENFNEELENITKNQSELQNTITEKYTRGNQQQIRWHRRTDQWTRRQNSSTHPIITVERKRNFKKYKDSLRDLWENIKLTNICIIGVPEGEERKGQEIYLKK